MINNVEDANDIAAAQNRRNHREGNIRRRNVRRNVPRVRVPYRQKYLYRWQLHPDRRRWLRPGNDEYHARCIACNQTMIAQLRVITVHATSDRHQQALANLENHDMDNDDENIDDFNKEVARIKIMLTAFFVKNKLPFRLIDDLLPLIKNISVNTNALQAVKMKRSKMTLIAKNVMARQHKAELDAALQRRKFSILFDESTDVSMEKHGCIVVRYFDESVQKVVSATYDIVNLYNDDEEEGDATAERIYERIMATFNNFQNIPRENLIGFCSGGASVMVGRRNSVAQRFRAEFPGIINHCLPITFSSSMCILCLSSFSANYPRFSQERI